MKLWLLRPIGYDDAADLDPLWAPWYDKTFGFVIRAESESDARALAQSDHGAEHESAWTPAHSTCVELTTDGPSEIIIEDYASA